MSTHWTQQHLERIGATDELVIAVARADGSSARVVPIWAVSVGDDVYVRTWYHRATGWFGNVLETHRAHIEVADVSADVIVDEIGDKPPELRAAIDAAYRTKYARYGSATTDRMASDSAASTTLKLSRQP